MLTKDLKERLNHPDRSVRMAAIEELAVVVDSGKVEFPDAQGEVNSHIHTTFSFSPYFPARAALEAREAGLLAAGSVDHDSIAAAEEMVAACAALKMGSTVGFEVRVNFTGTTLEGSKFNNPDSTNYAYICTHGVPHQHIDKVAAWLKPLNNLRNKRNSVQVDGLNKLLEGSGLAPLSFEDDIMPLSQDSDGGSITERHILYALAIRMVDTWGMGEVLVSSLKKKFGLEVPLTVRGWLLNQDNPHYLYDLLGVMKSAFLPRFFVQPTEEECISVFDAVDFVNSIGAIPSYAYLGDVSESPTGDKKAEKFEDDYLDDLVPLLKEIGFKAITYMPPRNTKEQLLRVIRLCKENGLMEISGVDINSSRQSFNCPEIKQPEFIHLMDATWALIAHEHLATAGDKYSLFNDDNPLKNEPLEKRLGVYAEIGKAMDLRNPGDILNTPGAEALI